ncbi:MAG: peptide chain release factor N(5)-glutamine methyltransferase [Ktedonobacterales bacterium]
MSGDNLAEREALASARSYGEALRPAVKWLRQAGVLDTPELDAQVLLSHVTGAPRATLLAFPERPLTPQQAESYAELVALRAAHTPVAYLTGHREFMGLDLLVDPRVLIPRPETELLVEAALSQIGVRLAKGAMPIVADIGTGSGAIALSVLTYEPRLPYIYATDVSADALALARENAQRLGVSGRVIFLESDLLATLPEPLDVLLANLPYVASRDNWSLPNDVRQYEPELALYGEDDGLGHLRRLFQQAPAHLPPGATLILEYGYDQREAVEALARETFPGCRLQSGRDLAGWDRYVVIQIM